MSTWVHATDALPAICGDFGLEKITYFNGSMAAYSRAARCPSIPRLQAAANSGPGKDRYEEPDIQIRN
jgi:hypothetical protein